MSQKLRTSTRRRISPQFIRRLSSWLVLSTGLTLAASATAKAASYYWDSDGNAAGNAITGAGLGDTTNPFVWDTTTPLLNWWDGAGASDVAWTNSFANTAVFTGTPGTVTLNNPIAAGALTFNVSGYTIAGNTLTLGGDSVIDVANLGDRETISSVIAGTDGLTKTGDGTLVLTNNANSFSGDVVINGGSVVITGPSQLGTGTTTISIGGIANTGNPGFSGGQLVLQGAGAGMILSRDISVSGRGPGAANNSGGLISIGNNTISGHITVGGPASQGNIVATHGITTITGNVQLGNSTTQTFFGNGNFIISGQVTGFEVANDRFAKSGTVVSTTLWLQNTANNFAESVRIDSGTVRVSTNSALGNNTSTQAVDLNNGILEVRTDTPGVGDADFSARKVFNRDNTNTGIFVSRDINGSAINQTVTFGETRATGTNTNFRITGRDGFNVTLTGLNSSATGIMGQGGSNSALIENNSSGLLTLATSSLWNQGDGTARTLTIQGNGDTLLTGNITRTGGGAHIVTKAGSGTFTIQGTASTFIGSFNANGGTTTINSFGAINNGASGALQLNGGALNYIGTDGTGAGETTAKSINLTGTTGSGIILANQTGTSPSALIIANGVAATGAGVKSLFLGGSSTLANEIQGVIQDNTGTNKTSLVKIGSGTWLYDPAASSYVTTAATGVTTTGGGAAQSNSFTVSSTTGLVVGETVTGSNVPGASIITAINGSTVTINNAIGTTAVASGTALTFGTINNFTGSVTVSGGTLQVKATAGSGNGSDVINNTSALIFNVDTLNTNQVAGGTFEYQGFSGVASTESLGALTLTAGAGTIKVTPGAGGTAALIFSSTGAVVPGTGANILSTGTVNVTGASGFLNGHTYFNGGDFAYADAGGTLRAPVYGTDSGFSAVDTIATNTHVALSTSQALPSSMTLKSLKLTGAGTALSLSAGQTLTLNSGVGVSSGILVSGGNAVSITGGTGLTAGSVTAGGGATTSGSATVTVTSTAALLAGMAISGTNIPANTVVMSVLDGTHLVLNQSATATTSSITFTLGNDLVFRTDSASDVLTLSTPITSSTTFGITKNGAGTLVLGGSNAQGGTTTVNEGILRLSGSGTVGTTNVNLTIRQDGTFDLNGVNVGTAASGTSSVNALNGSGVITNSAASGTATLRFGNNNAGGVFTGSIQDGATAQVALVKAGTGTVALTGANTFTGPVTILGGNLDIPNIADIGVASGIGTGDATNNATNAASLILNGGALRYVGTNSGGAVTATQTPSVSINRLFTLAGNGTISSFGSYGNVTASRGANNAALIFNNTADVAFSGAGTRSLTLDGDSSGDNEIRIHLTDNPNAGEALSLNKTSTGLWILNPLTPNTYSGVTTISGGALQATEGAGLPVGSNLLLSGGVFQTAGTFNRGLGTGAGQFRFVANGNGGFSSSTSKLTVDFSGLGTPVWGSTTNFLGAGSLILNNQSSLADVEVKGDFGLVPGAAATPTISTASGNATITITSGNTNGLTVGQAITGTNIPAGSYINAINGLNSITISQNASASGTGIAATIVAGGYRQIQVDDNSSTGLDFATVSGVISGTGGLSKIGAGPLILGDANTYSGKTVIRQESVFVTSIGAAGATSSSFGTNVAGGIVELGNPGSTTTVNLLYVGPGETTTREIDLTGTTGTRRIDSSGSGPLILTNLQNTTANSVNTTGGAKTLELHGTNTDYNMITSVLMDNAGALTVTKADGGIWILNPTSANTFTGNINANGGLLGLTANGIGAAGNVTISNGGIFAYGGDLTTSTNFVLANNSTAVFAGSNNITLNGTLTKAGGANDQTFSNNLENGAVLTINGNFIDAETGASTTRVVNIRGYGSTVFNGIVQNNSTSGTTNKLKLDIRLSDDGSVTLAGDNKGAALGFTGGILLGQGTLIVGHTGGLGPVANVIQLEGGAFTSTVDLTGTNAVQNKVSLQGDQVTINGSQSIEFAGIVDENGNRFLRNELTSGATLTLSGTINLSSDTNARTLTLRGASDIVVSGVVANGAATSGGLAYSGLSTLALTNANTATGALTVNRNEIVLSGNGTWSGSVTLNPIGTVTLDNSGTNLERLSDTGTVFGQGGTLNIIGAAGGSAETAGALTLNSVQTYITTSGGNVALTFASVSFANPGSSLNLSGISNLGVDNQVKFTTAPSGAAFVFNGVIPRIFLGGTDFAKYDATNGVVALVPGDYNLGNNLNTAAATDTLDLTASSSITSNRTINALKLDGNGLSVGGSTGARLTITSGGLINTGGDNSLDAQSAIFTNTPIFQIQAGTTLTVNSALLGSTNFIKSLPGTLVFNAPSFVTGTYNLLNGTTQLAAGGLNTFFPNQLLNINNGAVLDLNGGTQYVAQLSDPGILPAAGGSITTSTGTGTIVTNMAASTTFATTIDGSVNLARVGGNTLTLESVNTYTGATTMMGGTLQLQDDATILNTSSIDLNAATLLLNNNSSLQRAVYDRVGDATPITLRDGTIQFNGKVSDPSTETMGAVTSAQGANTISVNTGGTGTAGAFTSADVTFASLTRLAGTTVNFTGSNLGSEGNNARIYFTTPLTTYAGGVLGGWAIANSTDYAAYNTTDGVGVVGNGGFAGYDNTFGSGKITNLGTLELAPLTTTVSTNTTSALLKLSGNFTNNIAFATGSEVLNLELGGILRSNNVFDTSIGTAARRGVITAGGNEISGTRDLVIYNNATGNPTFGGGATTSGTSVITMSSTQGLQPGMTITNGGLPAGTTIVSVDSLTQATVSQNATATATSQTFTGGAFVLGATALGSPSVTMNSTTGIAPGMTITGTGIPAGTYVISVDSATGLTLSQNATANGSALTFTLGVSNMIINSVIEDNGFGNQVRLVKSGAGVLNLSANNLYTGGTVIDQGTVNLIGSGVVIPAGGLLIGGATLVENTNGGQIDPSNVVTIRRSSTLTLAGNNTLDSLIFDNNGGTGNPTVNIGGGNTLTLTNSAPLTVTNADALTVPTISAGTLALPAGLNTISVQGPTVGGVLYTKISPSLNITSVITGPGTSINKTGTGVLQLSGQNTFVGLTVSDGGILISGNSTPVQGGGGLVSGPLGAGSVSMAAGTTLLVDGSRTIGNDVNFAGTPTFDSTANTAWTLTLNGALSGAWLTPTPTVQINNPFLTVALLGKIPNIGTITSFNKTGLGTLVFNSTGYTGDFNATALGNPNQIQLLNDGDGTGSVETISLGNAIFDPGIVGTVVVGRAGGTAPYTQAQNKIIAPASVSNIETGLTVTNNNGYGLQVSQDGVLANPTFTVANATNSNVTQGLYLTGNLTGTGFTKSGNGTLVLGNPVPSHNTFTGNIQVNQGVLSVASDLELGNAANEVVLSPSTGAATLRATDDITTSRVISLANTANVRSIEVVGGKTLQLNTAFDLNGSGGISASLAKNDQGVLVLNAANPTWAGQLSILGGAVRVSANGALGTGATQVLLTGVFDAALQLSGGVTVANPINLNNSATNLTTGGVNSQGQLQNFSGTNTYSGAITLSADASIGSSSGTLNITGGISMATTTARALFFLGDGNITISGTSLTGGVGASWHRIEKIGNGTLTITNANSVTLTGDLFKIRAGTVVLSGAGTFTGSTLGNIVEQGATLDVDNSGTAITNRLGDRILTMAGGSFNYTLNTTSANSEAFGTTTFNSGGSTFNVVQNGTQNSTITFSTLAFGAGGTVNFTGAIGTSTNKIIASTAPALTPAGTGILPRATVNGNEFATYNATTGLTAFSGYAAATNILSAGSTQTFKATSTTANSLTGNQTLNALTLTSGTGSVNVGGLSGLTPTTLTLTSGAVLANGTGSGSTLSVPVVAVGGVEAILHVAAGQTLNVSSAFTGTAGMTKALPGVLNLNSQQFVSGNTTVNAGTLNLLGGTNTLLPGAGLVVNSGGTVDLNGNAQYIGTLASQDAAVGAGVGGGIITSSVPGATLATNTNSSFGGQITGSIYLAKAGGTLNLLNVNTYTGGTLVTGGTLNLSDSGTISNTASIDLNYGSLTLDDSRLYANADRVNDAAPITMRGGNITFQGRAQTASSETMGNVTLVEGNNSIFNTAGGTGVNTATLNFGALIRPAGSAATLRFNNLGAHGLINGVQTTFTQINGVSTATLGGGLTNNIIGPWAIVDREYASYVPGLGIGGLNAVGFPTGDAVNFTGALASSYNVRFGTTGTTVLGGDVTINTLTFTSPTAATTLDLGGHTLNLQGGGLLIGENTDNVNVGITDGFITAGSGGATDLYLTHANYSGTNRTASIDAVIEDNGGPLRLIKSSGDTGVSVLTLNGVNTYTGGTVLNQGTLVIGATGALGTGGITIGQATLSQTAGGVIPSQALTMNGSSTVTLANQANTLTSLTFNNNGGSAPTLNATGTLTLTGSITSNPSNVGTQSTITTGTVDLNGNNSFAITVNPTLVNGQDVAPWSAGLIINSIIQNGGIVKNGNGMLQLSGQSTFAGGVTVSTGGLIIAGNSTGSALDDVVTAGPLGTGTLTMGANTTMVSTGAFTVANNVVFLGDATFNGTNNLTLNGITTLPAIWNATVTAPQMTVTIGDASPSQPDDVINKSGLGTLVVGNYAGTIQATGGLVFTGDGNGFGTPESVSLGGDLVITGDTAVTINHSGSAPNARQQDLAKG
ncbi:autotransporter-associated beta strand repeat protein [Chthoniobacter flavus Ellin428]|uniref:Autotransporter-associated beta strand repeat protein n=1 Tax=Chthoniobacter flavus Ellin428 TaxID=497964 RepID=B4D4I4_9BACT|nr:autotransporter-associated beta strand repeat-containing protein [Chthoniobacter flavus]EDY18785.1 autotransporter-associated beta strand repeat protein [Chthoniobacter flavus Ellin428]